MHACWLLPAESELELSLLEDFSLNACYLAPAMFTKIIMDHAHALNFFLPIHRHPGQLGQSYLSLQWQ